MSHKNFGPDRFSRFDVYWIQTNKQTNRQTPWQAKFIYRWRAQNKLCLFVCFYNKHQNGWTNRAQTCWSISHDPGKDYEWLKLKSFAWKSIFFENPPIFTENSANLCFYWSRRMMKKWRLEKLQLKAHLKFKCC